MSDLAILTIVIVLLLFGIIGGPALLSLIIDFLAAIGAVWVFIKLIRKRDYY